MFDLLFPDKAQDIEFQRTSQAVKREPCWWLPNLQLKHKHYFFSRNTRREIARCAALSKDASLYSRRLWACRMCSSMCGLSLLGHSLCTIVRASKEPFFCPSKTKKQGWKKYNKSKKQNVGKNRVVKWCFIIWKTTALPWSLRGLYRGGKDVQDAHKVRADSVIARQENVEKYVRRTRKKIAHIITIISCFLLLAFSWGFPPLNVSWMGLLKLGIVAWWVSNNCAMNIHWRSQSQKQSHTLEKESRHLAQSNKSRCHLTLWIRISSLGIFFYNFQGQQRGSSTWRREGGLWQHYMVNVFKS